MMETIILLFSHIRKEVNRFWNNLENIKGMFNKKGIIGSLYAFYSIFYTKEWIPYCKLKALPFKSYAPKSTIKKFNFN